MSKDIRSFFTLKKPPKPKIEDNDDDIIPESPDVQVKNKKKDTKKRRVIKDSDSDDEIFTSKKKKGDKDTDNSKIKSKTQKPALKEVKAVDIFGSAPIKRTEPLVKKQKKTEIGIHSDEELEKSLLEIDNRELDLTVDEKNYNAISKNIEQPSTSKEITKENKKESVIDKKETKNTKSNLLDSKKELSKGQKSESTDISKHSKTEFVKQEKRIKHNDDKKFKVEISPNKSKDGSSPSSKESKKQKSLESNKLSIKEQVKLDNKRKFSEFVENDIDSLQEGNKKKKLNGNHSDKETITADDDNDVSVVENQESESKTKKHNRSLNESVLTDEERYDRKRHSAVLYQKYLNRSGPKQLGSKQIPEGKPDCLKDCAFVLTGVLDSFEKDEIAEVISKFGGSVKSGVSKKVTHVLAGEDAGPAKVAKAQDLGIKIINEDEFLKMIVDLSQNGNKKEVKKEKSGNSSVKREKSPKLDIKKEKKSPAKVTSKDKNSKDKLDTEVKKSKTNTSDKKGSESKSANDVKTVADNKNRDKSKSPRKTKEDPKPSTKEIKSEDAIHSNLNGASKTAYAYMWVDKHKPLSTKNIIGQHGEASNVKKLVNWLTKWYVNRKAKLPKPSPWAKNDDGGYFKAALLSGPPGVGKTTTVALVCKELGFDMVEFNASDTRNKTLIKEQIGELLTTTSLSAYAKGDTGKQAVTKKHVLVMDEVDGMAGNEDRGGLQELILLIKSTSVPIICMCNDRNSQKMRSLVNYCYDLRFNRPRVDQIKSAMMSICYKEGIKIPSDVLSELIVSANQDVRQTLNLLSMWAVDPNIADTERLRKDANVAKKDVKLGPWEAIRKVFSAEDHKKMSISDKSDLFFYDYSLAPLFVQENYLQVAPHCPKHEVLQRISAAADSISMGDIVDARIRRSQAWSMLPAQAMYSSVIPGHAMAGHLTGQIQFPGWLGKNSRATKMQRLCQEIHSHTRLSTSGSKSSVFLDYCTHLRDAIVNPLIKDKADGIDQSLSILESYHLLREDLDSLVELSLWPTQRNPTVLIDAKVKAAMTRTYNKKATALPYAPGPVKRGRAKETDENGEDEEIEEEEQDSDPENDALIKKKRDKAEKPSTSKGSSVKQAGKEKKKK